MTSAMASVTSTVSGMSSPGSTANPVDSSMSGMSGMNMGGSCKSSVRPRHHAQHPFLTAPVDGLELVHRRRAAFCPQHGT